MRSSLSLHVPSAKAGNHRVFFGKVTPKILYVLTVMAGMASAQPTSQPLLEPMPRQEMLGLFKLELGNLYRPDQADNYLTAHRAMENYFAATNTEQRKA